MYLKENGSPTELKAMEHAGDNAQEITPAKPKTTLDETMESPEVQRSLSEFLGNYVNNISTNVDVLF